MANEINIGDRQAVKQPRPSDKITIFYSMLKEELIQPWETCGCIKFKDYIYGIYFYIHFLLFLDFFFVFVSTSDVLSVFLKSFSTFFFLKEGRLNRACQMS